MKIFVALVFVLMSSGAFAQDVRRLRHEPLRQLRLMQLTHSP
jgi:hypothetical protein